MKEQNEIKKSIGLDILKIAIAVIITAVITYFITSAIFFRIHLNNSGMTYLSTKLSMVKKKLENEYIYDIDEDLLIEEAVKGYVNGLDDKYTEYLTKEEMTSLLENTSGNYVGIGVYLAEKTSDNSIVVIGVIEGSSAEDAGLQAGDIIKSVDGVEYKGEELEDASAALKGAEEGTKVSVVVIRGTEQIEFSIERRNIRLKAVSSEMKQDNLGYIKVSTFNEGTADEFKAAYENLKKQGLKALIIDLRNNGGGLVSESLEIADTMVNKGDTMLITSNKDNNEKIEKAKINPIVDVPVVILINENTASASEILAGCLRDNCNYKIIGTTSYGKGVIQTIHSFADGSGLKVTTEEYYTPKHNTINKVGISPDIEVNLNEEWKNMSTIPYENDLQLQRAIEEAIK